MRRATRRGIAIGIALALGAALALVVSLALALVAWPTIALAQGTGGSFGGGDWGGGGGGGGGSGSSGDDDGGGAFWLIYFAIRLLLVTVGPIPTLIIVAIGAIVWFAWRGSRRRGEGATLPFGRPPASGSPLWNEVDITAVRIALDWRARAFVEKRFHELAQGADPRQKAGLARLVAGLAQALEEARVAWLRAEVSNFHPMSPPQAEHHFRGLADEARAALTKDASGIADAREHASEGAVVVTLIVAAHRELVDVKAHDANDLAIALRGVRGVQPHELVAADLVWSPAARGTRMSLRELGARHPGLVPIAEHSIGARVFCASCRAPYPSELPRCPGCGTASPEAAARGGPR